MFNISLICCNDKLDFPVDPVCVIYKFCQLNELFIADALVMLTQSLRFLTYEAVAANERYILNFKMRFDLRGFLRHHLVKITKCT